MSKLIENVVSWIEKQERKRKTIRELSLLNDRDLADIGISRCDIYSIAAETAVR